jgi:hypothetical protein
VASAFVIQVQPQLQPDPNEETAALLRVLLYKMDNTTFGSEIPTIPRWTGPPHTIVQAQAMLYASLTVSLFSAFFAMLGKQWLNRYDSADVRGSAIERSQNRQRKHNGITVWYFNYVMESLPLMLQAALLLLGCALSLYLWEINSTIASVVLGVTSFGVIFSLSVVVAATASVSCPYQTPGSRSLRSAVVVVLAAISTCKHAIGRSQTATMLRLNLEYYQPLRSRNQIKSFLKDILCEIPRVLVVDAYHLGRAALWPSAALVHGVHRWFSGTIFTRPEQAPDEQTVALDLHCISWILHTSLDKDIHLVALEYFTTVATLAGLNPALAADCFNVFTSCVKVVGSDVVITPGLERLATVSALGLLRTFTHLSATDPVSRVLTYIHQRYTQAFPPEIRFNNLPFSYTFGAIHSLFHRYQRYWWVHQRDPGPSPQELVPTIRALTQLAQSKYRRREDGRKKVPRWILSFAMQSLLRNPHLPASAAVDCLSIVAIDLGCNIPNSGTMTSDGRYAHLLQISIPLTLD